LLFEPSLTGAEKRAKGAFREYRPGGSTRPGGAAIALRGWRTKERIMRVAIITGAGSGIGLETAKLLHAAGCAIVGVGRDTKKLATLEAAIGNTDQVATISVDVTADDAPRQIVHLALERFGRIDYLVNNAGVGSPTPLDETDDETLDYFLDIMLRSPFRLCREVIPHLGQGASVVNVTSTFAHVGGRRGGPYSAAKGGLKSLTEHMACEYGPRGIRSNCVAPASPWAKGTWCWSSRHRRRSTGR